MTPDPKLEFWLGLCLLTALYLIVRHWRAGRSAGLVFAYVLSFMALHWLAAAVYALPWYLAPPIELTTIGLRAAAIGLLSFGVGAEVGAVLFASRHRDPLPDAPSPANDRLINLFILTGAISYGVISPLAARVPTVGALVTTASSLMVIGVALKAWNAYQQRHRGRAWLWLAATGLFPFITLVGQGFLGFGFAAMLVVAAFVASFYRPRWHVVIVALLVAYGGLSIYVTYMRDRRDIRAVVWGGAAMSSRVDQLVDTFEEMEWFDPRNVDHLHRIDQRLNQDLLVGTAINFIQTHSVPLAHGSTILGAVLAVVPRALWPAKPVAAGSGDLVSTYTGLTFAVGTSVGVGHVLESYINFGLPGILFGLATIGLITAYVDRSASRWLEAGDSARFALWFLPGLSLLIVGGSFMELTSGAGAGLVVAWAFERVSRRWAHGPDADAEPDAPRIEAGEA